MDEYITPTKNWVRDVIIGLNFCPFAGRAYERETIRYCIVKGNLEKSLESLIFEYEYLQTNEKVETTLVIFPTGLDSFDDYLDFLELANLLLRDQGYEGIFQLASFHPNYCFAGVPPKDPSNYTNRSPFPMIHIIRETSLDRALAFHPDPEGIPKRNIRLAREMGEEKLKKLFAACFT